MNSFTHAKRSSCIIDCLLFGLFIFASLSPARAEDPPLLVINEFMASNTAAKADPQGQFDDWIEIYNAGAVPVDLAGMYLTDNLDNPTRWQIPTGAAAQTTLAPLGRLLVWADNDTVNGPLHAPFQLNANGEQIGLYAADGVTQIDATTFTAQSTDISYGRYPDAGAEWRFFATSTPGAQNTGGYIGKVADTHFSHHRGYYDAAFDVAITCKTEGSAIRYTTDGSEPSATQGQVYAAPVTIDKTTCLRAIAYKTDWLTTNIDTQTYIFLQGVLTQTRPDGYPTKWDSALPTNSADYEMDPEIYNAPAYQDKITSALLALPVVSIVTDKDNLFNASTGIYMNPVSEGVDWERPASVEFFDRGAAAEFQIDCGIRIQGGASREPNKSPKHSLRLLFKTDYGATKLEFPLFGKDAAQQFDTLILRSGFNNSWIHWGGDQRPRAQYIRDEWIRDVQRAMGQAAPHGRFVHVYLNGLYWGLYNLVERPQASFAANYYGGAKEEWDALNSGVAVDGTTAAWNTAHSIANAGVADTEGYLELSQYVDITNLADYMIVQLYGSNQDWDDHNWYAARQRVAGAGYKFFSWDNERVLEDPASSNKLSMSTTNKPSRLHAKLRANPEYRLLFADRLHKHLFNGGPLYVNPDSTAWNPDQPENNRPAAIWMEYANLLDQAVIAESARWGDYRKDVHSWNTAPFVLMTRDGHWIPERNRLLTQYFPVRTKNVLTQFRGIQLYPNLDAPVFSQHGGSVADGFQLAMTNPDAVGTIYYTTDGSDPRTSPINDPGGSTTLVPENAAKRVLVPTEALIFDWTGGAEPVDDDGWTVGTGGVGFDTATTYQSYIGIDLLAQMNGKQPTVYIRTPFTVGADVLASIASLKIRMRYDDGFIVYLNGAKVAARNDPAVPQWNSAATTGHNDSLAVNFEDFDLTPHINELKAGDNILAIHGMNESTASPDFLISFELIASEAAAAVGVSPTALPYQAPVALDQSQRVKARVLDGETWSALNEADFHVHAAAASGNLIITELNYNPLPPTNAEQTDPPTFTNESFEFIEIMNPTAQTIDLSGAAFTKGITHTFTMDGAVSLAPGQYAVLVADAAAFAARYGGGPFGDALIAGIYTDSKLSNSGERITVNSFADTLVLSFAYKDDGAWPGRADGDGSSIELKTPSPVVDFDDPNSWRSSAEYGGSPGAPGSGAKNDILINEVLTHTDPPQYDTIELYNPTTRTIDLAHWRLSDSSGNYDKFAIPAPLTLEPGDYASFNETVLGFALDGARGEAVWLLEADASGRLLRFIDHVEFGAAANGESFGRWPNGSGELYPMTALTNEATNSGPRVGPVVISEIYYNPLDISLDIPGVEFIEIYNPTDADIDLTAWRLRQGTKYDFTTATTLASQEALVVVSFDPVDAITLDAFRQHHGIDNTVRIVGPLQGRLDSNGDMFQLQRPDDPPLNDPHYRPRLLEDEVNYDDQAPWPTEADGGGKSLHRLGAALFGNDASNWKADTPTPGSVDFVTPAPNITSLPPETVRVGVAFFYEITASGDPAPTFSTGGIPSWLKFDGNKTLSGVPTESDIGLSATITILAMNTAGADTQQFQILVLEPPPVIPGYPATLILR